MLNRFKTGCDRPQMTGWTNLECRTTTNFEQRAGQVGRRERTLRRRERQGLMARTKDKRGWRGEEELAKGR